MNILIVGSGGREHAFAWKLKQSDKCGDLYVAPGNAGTDQIATNVSIGVNDFEKLGDFVSKKNISMLVVGPEDPLVNGIRDYFESKEAFQNLIIIGPGKAGAALEGSKDYSKAFMVKNNIPAGASKTFTAATIDESLAYISKQSAPIVLKADGLAAGKGVIIAQSIEEAQASIKSMLLDKQFGEASTKVLVEEYLDGIELSVFVLTDGLNYKILPEAKDYKRIGDGDTGPNTGGMGAISPVPFATKEFLDKVEERVVKPTLSGLQKENINYAGFIFIGLMNVKGDPYVIEYNVRMGDPETQVVLPRIKSDLLEVFKATGSKTLDKIDFELDHQYASTVVMVSGGYPGSYPKGDVISGINTVDTATVFHAGTISANNNITTNGGRVLAITGKDKSLEKAIENSYTGVEKITWKGVKFRKDIGQDILALLS